MLLVRAVSEILLLLTKPENVSTLVDNEALVGGHFLEDWLLHERWCPSSCCLNGVLFVNHKRKMFYQGQGVKLHQNIVYLLSSENTDRE